MTLHQVTRFQSMFPADLAGMCLASVQLASLHVVDRARLGVAPTS
jgi:hypothetical protein